MTLPAWNRRRRLLQEELWRILGRPPAAVEPTGEVRDRIEWDGVVVEKLVYETEPGQAVPALLYLPTACAPPFPALVICMGHGESKTTPGPLHAGPLFARLGIACLCADPIGEEERNRDGRCGTRAHDDGRRVHPLPRRRPQGDRQDGVGPDDGAGLPRHRAATSTHNALVAPGSPSAARWPATCWRWTNG